jgi:hypothetical protein
MNKDEKKERRETHHHEDGIRPPPASMVRKHIGQNPRHNGNRRTGTGTANHPKHKEASPAWCQCTRQCEEREDYKGNYGEIPPSIMFRQRAPNQRPKDVPDQENADWQDILRAVSNAVIGRNAGNGHAREGRGHG